MWTEEADQLFRALASDDAQIRRQSATDLYERFSSGRYPTPVPDAMRSPVLHALAGAVRKESDTNAVTTLAHLVRIFGTDPLSRKQTPSEQEATDALIQRLNESDSDFVTDVYVFEALKNLGIPARLRIVKEKRTASPGLVYTMIDEASLPSEALKILSRSVEPADWIRACENLTFFIGRVPRHEIDRALSDILGRAEGPVRAQIEEKLHQHSISVEAGTSPGARIRVLLVSLLAAAIAYVSIVRISGPPRTLPILLSALLTAPLFLLLVLGDLAAQVVGVRKGIWVVLPMWLADIAYLLMRGPVAYFEYGVEWLGALLYGLAVGGLFVAVGCLAILALREDNWAAVYTALLGGFGAAHFVGLVFALPNMPLEIAVGTCVGFLIACVAARQFWKQGASPIAKSAAAH